MLATLALTGAALAGSIRIDPRVEPFVDLWFEVRALGSGTSEAPTPEPLREAARAARALDAELKSPLAWGVVEGLLLECSSAADLQARLAELPETVEPRRGEKAALRAGVQWMAEGLAKAEPWFRETMWPAREKAVRARWKDLEQGLLAPDSTCLARHARAIGAGELELTIPCFLVSAAPAPGAITHRSRGRGVCFVAVDGFAGSALAEAVVHEATHAIDVAAAGDVFDQLRDRIRAAGEGQHEQAFRELPHTLMFVQSAATVRGCLDPEHEDYGHGSAYYSKVQRAYEAVAGDWRKHLEGKLALGDALDGIVRSYKLQAPR